MLELLFNTFDNNRRVSIGAITLDATIREQHQFSNTVTENPLEDGSIVTDHIFSNPYMLLIEGEITDSPVQFFSGLQGISERRIEAFEQLVALRDSKDLITVVTGYKVYNDIVITNLTFPRDQTTGKRLQFSAEFMQVRKVASQIVDVPEQKLAEEQKDIASGEVNIGKQTAAPADDVQVQASSSLLSRITTLGGSQ